MRNAKPKTQNTKPYAAAQFKTNSRDQKPTDCNPSARLALALLLCSLIFLPSCGYSTKPPFNASVRTICVPIFANKTFRREWEFRLTEAIDKNIEYRTPFKIADRKNADTLLTGEIKQIQENILTRRFGTDLPRENELTVVVDFTWKDLRSGRLLVERKNFNRSATEIPQIGERVEDAEQLAIERLAAAIVDQLQSDWGTEPTTAPSTRP